MAGATRGCLPVGPDEVVQLPRRRPAQGFGDGTMIGMVVVRGGNDEEIVRILRGGTAERPRRCTRDRQTTIGQIQKSDLTRHHADPPHRRQRLASPLGDKPATRPAIARGMRPRTVGDDQHAHPVPSAPSVRGSARTRQSSRHRDAARRSAPCARGRATAASQFGHQHTARPRCAHPHPLGIGHWLAEIDHQIGQHRRQRMRRKHAA